MIARFAQSLELTLNLLLQNAKIVQLGASVILQTGSKNALVDNILLQNLLPVSSVQKDTSALIIALSLSHAKRVHIKMKKEVILAQNVK